MNTTSITLLERLREPSSEEAAWNRFVDLYTPLLFQWARGCGLQPDDASDLVQDVFTAMLQKLPEFTYDRTKSFRAWLRTVTMNLWRDRCRAVATRPMPGCNGREIELTTPDHVTLLEDQEYRQYLISRSLKLMQAEFSTTTWRAAWEHGVLERPAAQVAAELGLTVAAVYCARIRVLNRLRQDLQGFLE